jgi:hypothetical protein
MLSLPVCSTSIVTFLSQNRQEELENGRSDGSGRLSGGVNVSGASIGEELKTDELGSGSFRQVFVGDPFVPVVVVLDQQLHSESRRVSGLKTRLLTGERRKEEDEEDEERRTSGSCLAKVVRMNSTIVELWVSNATGPEEASSASAAR